MYVPFITSFNGPSVVFHSLYHALKYAYRRKLLLLSNILRLAAVLSCKNRNAFNNNKIFSCVH